MSFTAAVTYWFFLSLALLQLSFSHFDDILMHVLMSHFLRAAFEIVSVRREF